MTDDAMEWHATTPPALHDPCHHSYYMPGQWPESTLGSQPKSDALTRKRKLTTAQSASKRVCDSLRTLGAYAAVPVQPIYLIVRYWRGQQRDQSRRPRRDPAQSRRSPPALRARIADAEQRVRAGQPMSTPQQTATPPASPSREHQERSLRGPEEKHTKFDSTVATNANNTERSIFTPTSLSSPAQTHSDEAAHGLGENLEAQSSMNHSTEQRHLGLGSHPAVVYADQKSELTTSTSLRMKKLNTLNRFDAGYRRNRAGDGQRSSQSSIRLRSIGTKLNSKDQVASLFGGWEHEAPLNATPLHLPTPSEQMQSELETHVTSYSPFQPFQRRTNELIRSAASLEPHDERWSSDVLLDKLMPENFFEMSSSKDEIPQLSAPPPIRNRLNRAEAHQLASQVLLPSHTSAQKGDGDADGDADGDSDIPSTSQHQTPLDTVDVHSVKDLSKTENQQAPDDTDNEANIDVSPGAIEAKSVEKLVPPPSTPLKNTIGRTARLDAKTSDVTVVQEHLPETPVESMAKLNIKVIGDSDTPKATPHSGTKTTRITRYREALERQQKSKLEQYELVAINEEWDRRVRAAVRNGIPDFLGAHDLARVVPQYAGRGQDNWLNDETINKYLELVAAHGRKADRPDQVRSHHAFNNFFYNNLRSKGADSVTRWSKRAKIGGKSLAYVEKVFVPINSGAHWTLAVVEPTQKKITHYNSMRGTATGIRACEDLLKWVAVELGKDFQEEEWTLVTVGESPQQTNSDDCGVFTITSARQIMLGLTPMSYGPAQIPVQRIRIVAELINKGLLRSSQET